MSPRDASTYPGLPGAALAAGAALFAAAELGFGLLVGRFFDPAAGRAEALIFFAIRPWLLLVAAAAAAAAGWRPRDRAALYGLALLVAGLAESLFLLPLGGDPWAEMLRGWAAGGALVLILDLAIAAARRFGGRRGGWAAVALLALLLLVPGVQAPYERVALGPTAPRPAAERPALTVMTSLPIIWGEGGAFDPDSRPAAAWRALQREFEPRAVDYLDETALRDTRLALLAQPRLLAPEELVALDAWLRAGGRALILADPALVWPGGAAPGDPRRPAGSNMLAPLMTHWGVALEARPQSAPLVVRIDTGRASRRLRLLGAGRFISRNPACAAEADFVLACRIEAGAAILVADADLLHDESWTGPGPRGERRHARTADNPLAVADWLDRLAGLERARADASVRWTAPEADVATAAVLGALPILLAGLAALGLRRRR